MASNCARGHSPLVARVDDHDPLGTEAERALRHAGNAADVGAAFGGAVAVLHRALEALREALDVEVGGLVAEHPGERVVGVVGLLGRREDVRQRLAHVVEVRDAVLAHVGEEARRREPSAQHTGCTHHEPRREPGDDRVGVEQRHHLVHHVVGHEVLHLTELAARRRGPALRQDARLRRAARPRREQQEVDALGVDVDVR